MIVEGIGVVFLKKKGRLVSIYRQGITRNTQEDGMIGYRQINGEKFRIISCMYPALEGIGLYVQGKSYKLDRDTLVISLPKLRSIFNTLVFSSDAHNMSHTTIVL